MKKELSPKKIEELLFLKEWNCTVIDYFIKKEADPLFKQFHQVIIESFNKNNIKGLKTAYTDNNDMARDLPPSDLNELNQILREKFGYDLTKANDQNLAKIKRIVQKGHLKTDDEFRLLLNRVDDIYADDNMKDEVEILNKLMHDYEDNKRSKLFKKHV